LLTDILPSSFGEVLESLQAFADPILTGTAVDAATWDPARRGWFASPPKA